MIKKSNAELAEKRIIRYFRDKKNIARLESKINLLKKQFEKINHDIENVHNNIRLDVMPPSLGISDGVQTGFNSTSYFEKQLEMEVTKLEKIKFQVFKEKIRCSLRKNELEKYIQAVEFAFNELDQEEREFIYYLYDKKKNIKYISNIFLNVSESTAYRMKNRILEKVMKNI
ncbi:hypothetical protein FC758_12390 [Clostridium botulinum]|nr:hypothetical protein [Clostridium botulinum]NFL58333.1 hypothetical protein [Clostridium botulinum]NFL62577.1 hypothetical protein [Clostridium botulinum]